MSGGPDMLITALATDLRPVKRLWHPAVRALAWLAVVLALGILLAMFSDLVAMSLRLAAAPDLWWSTFGAILTAMAAALAAFQMSVPGRSAWWSVLPLPAVAVWLGSSSWGCLRSWGLPGLAPADMHDAMGCATFITLVSIPLAIVLVVMLRRACPLWPGRVAAMGGLAAAAAAASLLTLFHPHDASAVDVVMHVFAVALVVSVTRWAGG